MPSLDQLQRVADHRTVRKHLRAGAIGSIVFGTLAVAAGGATFAWNPLNAVLAMIGVFLLAEGIWVLAAPRPVGFVVEGAAILVVGIWNILITIANMLLTEGGRFSFWGILGVFQIIWAIQSFRRYGRYAGLEREQPPRELLDWVDRTAKSITSRKAKDAEDIVAFTVKGFWGVEPWKGSLWDDMAMFLRGRGATQEILFVSRDDLTVAAAGSRGGKKPVGAEIRLGQLLKRARIAPLSLQRLQAWKAGGEALEA